MGGARVTSAENAICEILRDGKPVGLGFALDPTHVLTCAHVLNTALGRPQREASDPGLAIVTVTFPIGRSEGDTQRQATLGEWLPTDPARFDAGDLAILELADPVPPHVPALAPARGTTPMAVQMWGPQPQRRTGGHVAGQLMGSVRGVRQQITVNHGHFKVRPGFSGGPVWLPGTNEVAGILVACGEGEQAVDAYLLGVEEIGQLWLQWRRDRRLETTRGGESDLFHRVTEAIGYLPELADAQVRRTRRGGQEHLLVTRQVPVGRRVYREDRPILVHAGEATDEQVENLLEIARHYENAGFDIVRPTLVYTGSLAPPALRERASLVGIDLQSLAQFQTGVDLDAFAVQQHADLDADTRYPEDGYVPQRFREPPGKTEHDRLREKLLLWLAEPEGHLIVVLAPFGHGKTYLLHEVARHIHRNPHYPAKPVLVRLSELDSSIDLDHMVAWQLRRGGQRSIDYDWLAYMRREGRIVLLLDGFDELARRVSYGHAAAHLEQIQRAAEGRAKIVLTSRREFFLSDSDTERAFGHQLSAGRRMVIVSDFTSAQIHAYLAARNDEQTADRWLALLTELGLLDLAANPRMLGMLTDIGQERLATAAKQGKVTKAWVFDEVLKAWLTGEYERSNPHGAQPGPWVQAMRTALTGLASRLWREKLPWLTLDDLRPFAEGLTAVPGADRLSTDEAVHRLGVRTLLVRLGDNQFDFVNQSLMEWLVVQRITALLLADTHHQLDEYLAHPLSPVQIELLEELAGREKLTTWIQRAMRDSRESIRGNAVTVSQQLGISVTQRQLLRGQDLRGQDFTGRDLTGAELAGADLTDALLEGATLTGADLSAAKLLRARLSDAILEGANLSQTDMRQARLDGARLNDALVAGANFTDATLCGADLRGIDWGTVGAARRAATLAARTDPQAVSTLERLGAATPQMPPELFLQTGAAACSVSLHPGGEFLAAANGATVTVWNLVTGRPVRQLVGHTDWVWAVAYSPDGQQLATGGDDRTVRLWNSTGRQTHLLQGHRRSVHSVAYSPDGQQLATASNDHTVRIWNTATGTTSQRLSGHTAPVRSAAFSPDGHLLATGSDDYTVRVWNITTGQQTHQLDGHNDAVAAVAFSPDGHHLASGGNDHNVRVWNTATSGAQVHRFTHTGSVRAVAYSPDGVNLAAGSANRTVRVWNTTTGQHTDFGHSGSVWSVAYSADGAYLAVGSDDYIVRVWNTLTGQQSHQLESHVGSALAVAYSPDGEHFAVGSNDFSVRIWHAATGRLVRQLNGHTGSVWSVAYSPDGTQLATAGDDQTVRIWETATGQLLRRLNHSGSVWSLAYSPDGAGLASGSDDSTLWVWNPHSAAQPAELMANPAEWVLAVAYSPDGRFIATGGDDRQVHIWNTATGAHAHHLHGHDEWIRCVAYSPDGRSVATASDDHSVRIWDTVTGDQIGQLHGHTAAVRSVAFSPDGSLLATSGNDHTVRIWAAAGGRQLHRLDGHTDAVRSVVFSPDGRYLISGSYDHTVRIWRAATGAGVATLRPLADGWAAFCPDGRYKYEGNPRNEFWWATGLARLEPGQADPHVPAIRRVDADEPLEPAR